MMYECGERTFTWDDKIVAVFRRKHNGSVVYVASTTTTTPTPFAGEIPHTEWVGVHNIHTHWFVTKIEFYILRKNDEGARLYLSNSGVDVVDLYFVQEAHGQRRNRGWRIREVKCETHTHTKHRKPKQRASNLICGFQELNCSRKKICPHRKRSTEKKRALRSIQINCGNEMIKNKNKVTLHFVDFAFRKEEWTWKQFGLLCVFIQYMSDWIFH